MGAFGGPNIQDDNLVFYYDNDSFPKGWDATITNTNPECLPGQSQPIDHSCFTSGAYLGALTSGILKGGTYTFSGGDLSNYWATNPEYRGWNAGGIGSTGGNWVQFTNALPATVDPTRQFMILVRWRFVYVSRTGNGTANPTFQLGRGYYQLYGKNFYDVNYEWQTARLYMKGDFGGGYSSLTLGCTSADSAVEVDYVRCYEVNPSTGVTDLTGVHSLDFTNTTINSIGEVIYDGTNDYINVPHQPSQNFTGDFSIEAVIYPSANTANCIIQKGSGNDYFQDYWLLQDMRGSNRYISLIMGQTGNTSANYINTGNISILNKYHHIVATVSSNTAKIYVNSVQQATGSISNRTQSTSDMRIGWRVDGFAATAGIIPIVKTYNRALTASEVASNFNGIRSRFNI